MSNFRESFFHKLALLRDWSGTSFWCTFSAYFSHKKCSSLNTQLTKFQYQTFFPSEDTKQCVFQFLFRQLMTSETLRFIFNHLLEQLMTREKSGRGEYKNLNILRIKKSFLDEIKSISQNFSRAIVW